MKKTFAIITVMVLTVSLFTGCGCRNSAPAVTTEPTLMPTTMPATQMTTEPTTIPTTESTINATIEDGNGPISTDSTENTVTSDARSRTNDISGTIGSGNGITGSITG